MATVRNNDLIEGLSGKFGRSLVFRTMRDKTFISAVGRKPDKGNESVAQRSTRVNFKNATAWARKVLRDPEKKVYYQQRAKALKLPNAYTAAITDYMRKPKVTKTKDHAAITYRITKPGFRIKEVKAAFGEKADLQRQASIYQQGDTWFLDYIPDKEFAMPLTLMIMDNTMREIKFEDLMT